jgi:geranylgeranyl transferase type-2 subunit alpha
MNALAHNCSLLSHMKTTTAEEKGTLLEEMKRLYERLEVIDEDRKERYRDLSKR